MNALLSLICLLWMTTLLALAAIALPVSASGVAGLRYHSPGHVTPKVSYDGTRPPASDYDSGWALPIHGKEGETEQTSAVFVEFAESLAAHTGALVSRHRSDNGHISSYITTADVVGCAIISAITSLLSQS